MFHFLAEFFAFNLYWALSIFVILWVALTALIETKHGVLATVIGGLAVWGMVNWGSFHPIAYVKAHPGYIALGVLGYLAAGTLWMIFKWILFVKKQVNEYNEAEAEFLETKNAKELTPELAVRFKDRMGFSKEYPPQVKDYEGDLFRWAMGWPFSSLWFLIHDPFTRAFKAIINALRGTLQGISNRMFASIVTRLNAKPTPPAPVAKAKQIAAMEED